MRLSLAISTANVAEVADGGWAMIAPYGVHPSPGGDYVQSFTREQAEKAVATWNSLPGLAARWLKNLVHGRMSYALPVFDGHPDSDKQRWPKEKILGDVTDLRAGGAGLEGQFTWNAKGADRRTRGPLFPSPLWWHWPAKGEPPTVYPELLESIGLVPTPNISSVPAWTANATFAGNPQAENKNENTMNDEQLKALRKALGLPENADAVAILAGATTANAAVAQLTERETALQTANSAQAELENKITTLTGQVPILTAERDQLKTANSALTTEVGTLRKGVLDLAEKKGAITPAERPSFETRLTTANTAADTLNELLTRKAMNTKPVEIHGNRVDISTANARATAVNQAVARVMKEQNLGYDDAFARVSTDPDYAALFAAMAQPKQQAA